MGSLKIAAVILAAGNSSRLGVPKQLLVYKESTLLENAIKSALEAKCSPVVVVLGAYHEQIQSIIAHLDVTFVYNTNWLEGMGTSISQGIKHLDSDPQIDAALIMVCDQPYLTSLVLDQLINIYNTSESKIIASEYNDTLGVPAIFDRLFFEEMNNLKGNEGAKNLIINNQDIVSAINFPLAVIDIDTKSDYENLIK